MEDAEREIIRDLKVARRIIDRLASEARDAGMLVRAWNGPRQSRLYVYHWVGGSELASAGYVEVELNGRPPSTNLRANWYTRTAARNPMFSLAARAGELLEESHAS